MKQSQLFTKTQKVSKEYDSKNATFLIKGGFIDQTMSGVWNFLPLGYRVLAKIENIIREEMDEVGVELLMSSFSPKEFWEKTGRSGIDVLLEARGANEESLKQNSTPVILNPTHEDLITPLVQKHIQSYKDLPVALYQIQTKFRNEARPKSGLLRSREFRMKDLYSFHANQKDLMEYYEKVKHAYINIFEKLGIGHLTVVALASGGDFTENYSHEFQTKCEIGEDTIFHDTVSNIYYNQEVAPSKAPSVKQDTEKKQREDVYGEGIVSVEKLTEFLNIEITRTIKTVLYKADDRTIAVAVRGNYEVNEEKVKKVVGCKNLRMLTEDEILEETGAEVGYAGIVNLPKEISMYCDEALEEMVNFEVGINKTNYHALNANWNVDVDKPDNFYDLKIAKEGDLNPNTGSVYSVFAAAEVGNIFPLETKFAEAFNFTYLDQNGKPQYLYMGSYGIGPSRVMGVIAEVLSDEKGIVWPEAIAPFKVHLISLTNEKNDEVYEFSEAVYDELRAMNVEVLWDDRVDIRPGEKFADSDLIGIPYRVVVSARTLKEGRKKVEVKMRSENEIKLVEIADFFDMFR
ncbi:MAG: proline--tRNA ligase [Candidatus Dojkabacteria bacterium]